MSDLVMYYLKCATSAGDCHSAIAFDAAPGIDVNNLHEDVAEDSHATDMLHAAHWRQDHGHWICGDHQPTDGDDA